MATNRTDYQVPTPILRAHRPKADVSVSSQKYLPDVKEVDTEDIPLVRKPHYLVRHSSPIGAGMIVMMMALWIGINHIVPFVTQAVDRWNCGQHRICHYDINVGHEGTSHFIAQYWHEQVIVIEFVGGNPAKTQVYTQALLSPLDTSPRIVTLKPEYLSFHPIQGKPDLLVTVSGFFLPLVFYNTGTGFTAEAR